MTEAQEKEMGKFFLESFNDNGLNLSIQINNMASPMARLSIPELITRRFQEAEYLFYLGTITREEYNDFLSSGDLLYEFKNGSC